MQLHHPPQLAIPDRSAATSVAGGNEERDEAFLDEEQAKRRREEVEETNQDRASKRASGDMRDERPVDVGGKRDGEDDMSVSDGPGRDEYKPTDDSLRPSGTSPPVKKGDAPGLSPPAQDGGETRSQDPPAAAGGVGGAGDGRTVTPPPSDQRAAGRHRSSSSNKQGSRSPRHHTQSPRGLDGDGANLFGPPGVGDQPQQ